MAWKEAAGDPAFPVLALELHAASPEDLLATVVEILVRRGWVTTEFEQALKQREARLPTGLQLVVGALALPHTECVHFVEVPFGGSLEEFRGGPHDEAIAGTCRA
jgi:mannitol/fructose-specific phosphotransferase system IIA component (Ntr-type)